MDKKSNRGVMLVISVLLHSLLALLPWQEKSRPLAVSSTPTSPIPIVDASQLPTLPASESQPLPAVPSSPPVPDVPLPETIDSPIDEPALEAALPPDFPIPETIDSPIGEPAPEAAPEDDPTSVTPIDEAKIAADWDHLVDYFQGQNDGLQKSNALQLFKIYAEELVDQFFDTDKPKFDEPSFSHLETKTPEQVFETVVMPELESKTGFALQLQENFPAGQAYQLSQGEMIRYLIIVGLGEGNGSFLMLSESLPGLEP